MPTRDWAKGRNDEAGPGSDTKSERPEKEGNPARGKENVYKSIEPHRGRQLAEGGKANRVDAGDARKNAR